MEILVKMKRNIIFILIITFLFNCSGHSTISPKTLKKGQSYQAITYSFDSMVPLYIYRKGIGNGNRNDKQLKNHC